jgi:hypothetical protein
MLRALQLQINNRTVFLDQQKSSGKMAAQELTEQHKAVAQREKKLQELAEKMQEKLQSTRVPEGGPGRD